MLDLFKFSKRRFLLLTFLFFLVFSMVVSARPPFETQSNIDSSSLQIAFPKTEFFELDVPFSLHFHVYNSTSYLLTNDSLSCFIHVYDSKNNHVIKSSLFGEGADMTVDINSSVYANEGAYTYITWCNSTGGEAGFVSNFLKVNEGGRESTFNSLFIYLIAIAIAFIIYGFGLYQKSYTPTIIGGFMMFIIGVWVLIEPIAGLVSWINYLIGACLFAWGAYVFIVVSIEETSI